MVIIFGGHYIWQYRQKLPFKKLTLKFNGMLLFDAIVNIQEMFGSVKANFQL